MSCKSVKWRWYQAYLMVFMMFTEGMSWMWKAMCSLTTVIIATPVLLTGTSPVVSLQTTSVYCIPADSNGKSNGWLLDAEIQTKSLCGQLSTSPWTGRVYKPQYLKLCIHSLHDPYPPSLLSTAWLGCWKFIFSNFEALLLLSCPHQQPTLSL